MSKDQKQQLNINRKRVEPARVFWSIFKREMTSQSDDKSVVLTDALPPKKRTRLPIHRILCPVALALLAVCAGLAFVSLYNTSERPAAVADRAAFATPGLRDVLISASALCAPATDATAAQSTDRAATSPAKTAGTDAQRCGHVWVSANHRQEPSFADHKALAALSRNLAAINNGAQARYEATGTAAVLVANAPAVFSFHETGRLESIVPASSADAIDLSQWVSAHSASHAASTSLNFALEPGQLSWHTGALVAAVGSDGQLRSMQFAPSDRLADDAGGSLYGMVDAQSAQRAMSSNAPLTVWTPSQAERASLDGATCAPDRACALNFSYTAKGTVLAASLRPIRAVRTGAEGAWHGLIHALGTRLADLWLSLALGGGIGLVLTAALATNRRRPTFAG